MKNAVKLLSLLMVVCMLLSACAQGVNGVVDAVVDSGAQNNTTSTAVPDAGMTNGANPDNLSTSNKNDLVPEKGSYNEGVVLVKCDGDLTVDALCDLEYTAAEPLYRGSSWYVVTLGETMDTVEAVKYLSGLDCFEAVDYDYIMKADGEVQSVDISGNTYAENLTYLETMGVKKGWEDNLSNGKTPGGSPDVIIAIIDTGVDYNHQDLRNNIWVNPAEIPNNGIDDDNNGYVDDIHGWNCVGNNNDPMDDNGHGTHVAGIAAAENNKIGTVGVAYNCKIMVLKAGNSSGYFNNSDIAEAIQYAYMNGASVINMSFGGYSISLAVEDALENAYHQCVLVAAAGNDALCNHPSCQDHLPISISYPAALPYVIGVMSCNENGSKISGFSNFDHYPFGSIEYEVYACGESITSTWPNNKYATLSGTSMAAPTVAGIAAVLRSTYSDREVYSNKYIQSQIVNTGTKGIMTHTVADLYEALTKIPTPNVKLYDYYIFDNVEFSEKNNGDGVIDAGETIRFAIELQNRGGVATNVVATLNTMRHDDPLLVDPYFNITKNSITLSDIGTYSVRDCGKIYNGNLVIGTEQYFEILVSEDCPHSYLSDFNVCVTYNNGLNENDTTMYSGKDVAQLSVSNGIKLPSIFSEDTTLTAGKKYIVSQEVIIPKGVTVNVDPGVEIQFYEDNLSYYNSLYNSPRILVLGELNFNGSEDEMIYIHPSELFGTFVCQITIDDFSKLNMKYTKAVNLDGTRFKTADHCEITIRDDFIFNMGNVESGSLLFELENLTNSHVILNAQQGPFFDVSYADNNLFELVDMTCEVSITEATNNVFITTRSHKSHAQYISLDQATNNLFMTSNNSTSAADCASLNINDPGNTFLDAYGLYYYLVIEGFYTTYGDGTPLFDINDKTNVDLSKLWPFVKDVTITNADGEEVKTVGVETFNVKLEFNRPVSATADLTTFFGSWYPYADYSIDGEFTSDTVWEGTYTMKAFIEDGTQYLTVDNIAAKDDAFKELVTCRGYYSFDLDTTGAMSMNLIANPFENGIELNFVQDDYDTLLGYNIYRSTEKDGNYVKLNPAILLSTDESFVDENAEPGKTYWYTYTVVLTDFSESKPAGKVMATAKDTLAPNLYHTPVNQGYLNNNLVISCTASDNVSVASVVLYYRTTGTAEWKSLSMLKQNDKYSVTVFGSELTLAGFEYYIVAYDTNNFIVKGSADAPYTVIIKDASAISRKGDVDGNGVVDAKDALMIMQCINGDLIMTDDEFKRADLNGDGILSSMEALRILQYINGNVNTLEM